MSVFMRLPDGSYATLPQATDAAKFTNWVKQMYDQGGVAGTDVLVIGKALKPDNTDVTNYTVAAPLRLVWFTTQPPVGYIGP